MIKFCALKGFLQSMFCPLGLCLIVVFIAKAKAAKSDCEKGLIQGATFLHARYPKLHERSMVRRSAQAQGLRTQRPIPNIAQWLVQLPKQPLDARLKSYFLKRYVTRPADIPEAYFDAQILQARQQGYGVTVLSAEQKNDLVNTVLEDQRTSLEHWLNYFWSEHSKSIPVWAKYWALKSVVTLGLFDPEAGVFGSRRRGQVAPFPDLNAEALGIVMNAVVSMVTDQPIPLATGLDLPATAEALNFGKLYGYVLRTLMQKQIQDRSKISGRWIRYPRGSNPDALVASLTGRGTGWCTVGPMTARDQLKGGDFHVYYSMDQTGRATIPRVAIRCNHHLIGEIRGVAKHQHLDPQIADSDVLGRKLDEFGPAGEHYQKASRDMRQLNEIERKIDAATALNAEDLRFLYELDAPILTFGQQRDPRIKELLRLRNRREDISEVFSVRPEQVSLNEVDLLDDRILVHVGDLKIINGRPGAGPHKYFAVEKLSEFRLPPRLFGSLYIEGFSDLSGAIFPEHVSGSLTIASPVGARANHLKFPDFIGGDWSWENLVDVNDVILPNHVGGNFIIPRLRPTVLIQLPNYIGGSLNLRFVKNFDHFVPARRVTGNVLVPKTAKLKAIIPILPLQLHGELKWSRY